MTENKCEHELCGCPTDAKSKYCSDHCREATEHKVSEIACDCGCPGCK